MDPARVVQFVRNAYGGKTDQCVWLNGRTLHLPKPGWVVRVGAGASTMAAVLRHIDGRLPGTALLVPSTEGFVVTACDGVPIAVTTHVAGRPPELAPADLRAVGAALGRLHALPWNGTVLPPPCPVAEEVTVRAIPHAAMLPSNELRDAAAYRERWLSRAPATARGQVKAIADAIEGVQRLLTVHSVLLHGDCHPWNAVIQPSGDAALVDWDSSGPGPGLVDLGFLLLSAAMGAIDQAPIPFDPLRVAAVAHGYADHVRLSTAELDLLPQAILFRSLVFEAGVLAEAIEAGAGFERTGWWSARRLQVERVAEVARAGLSA